MGIRRNTNQTGGRRSSKAGREKKVGAHVRGRRSTSLKERASIRICQSRATNPTRSLADFLLSLGTSPNISVHRQLVSNHRTTRIIMKHCVVLALLGLVPFVLATEIISANPPLPCTHTEHCFDYTTVPANATCKAGFCICQNATDTYNCSSAGVTHSDMKNTGTIQRPCNLDQECNFGGGICNRTIRQCDCNTTYVLSSNKQKCLEKASNIGFPCTDEKQCLAFLPNTTCSSNECICVSGYHFADDHCYKKVGFGENCTVNGECSHITGAICMEQKVCGCPAETVINMDVKRCLPVAREIGEECVEAKQCSMTFADSLCIDKKCQCQESYHYEAELSRCFLSKTVGENCGNSYECYQASNEGENVTGKALQCLSNTCDCAEDYYRDGDKCVNAASLLISTSLLFLVPVLFLQVLLAWT